MAEAVAREEGLSRTPLHPTTRPALPAPGRATRGSAFLSEPIPSLENKTCDHRVIGRCSDSECGSASDKERRRPLISPLNSCFLCSRSFRGPGRGAGGGCRVNPRALS